jgi:hypothetical protein
MGLLNEGKLNRLASLLPEGVVAPSGWLASQGFSRQLVRKYVQSGWLQPLARGAFARPGTLVDAESVILGLQRLANAQFHVGGVSALNRLGHAHYLQLAGESEVHLWGTDAVPTWPVAVPHSARLVFHRERLFDERAHAVGLENVSTRVRNWTLTVSGLERAMMEVLSLVNEDESSFLHASELFEGLTALRPQVATKLLTCCRSLKVKRLFLFLSAHYHYPWSEKIDRSGVDLGKGKRQIFRGGRYVREFRITVPERFGAERR